MFIDTGNVAVIYGWQSMFLTLALVAAMPNAIAGAASWIQRRCSIHERTTIRHSMIAGAFWPGERKLTDNFLKQFTLEKSMIKRILLSLFLVCVASSAEAKKIKHVVLIGMDGMAATYIPKSNMASLQGLMRDGAFTLHARSVLTTSSAVNWAAMLMGVGTELHGYTMYDSKTPEIPSRVTDKYGLSPTIFALLHDQKPSSKIGVFYDWDGIGYLFPKQAVNIAESFKHDEDVVARATAYIKTGKPTLTFVYMEAFDVTGHRKGWDTPEYYAQATRSDQNIAAVLQSIKDAGIADSTIVIVSADHGGILKNHGGKTLQEVEIPWIISGPGIKKNFEITDSVVTYDTAATIANIFKLKTPQVWTGRPVKSAFNK
jgi:hypothetical protein